MKNIILSLFILSFAFNANAQIIEYSEPSNNKIDFSNGITQAVDSTRKDSTEVLSSGEIITHYYYEAFDFGKINTEEPQKLGNQQKLMEGDIETQNTSMPLTLLSKGVDTSKDVGEIPFSEGTTPSGGKTYSIPIFTARAVSSSPQISLVYNSQGGNGVAGMGWEIGGISAISVIGKSIYFDNKITSIDLDSPNECSFALDGTRLVYNIHNIENEFQYETSQGFILVKKHPSSGPISHFTALYPNGTTATFGFVDNTKTKYVYPLTSIVDIRGYRVDYEYLNYEENGNKYYIDKIKYGGESSSSHLSEIIFEYTTREDIVPAFISGIEVESNKLLTKVTSVHTNGEELRVYTLTHNLEYGITQLTQIDCSVDSHSLNPLSFTYNTPPIQNEILTKGHSKFLSSYFSSNSSTKPAYSRGKFVKNRYNDGLITYITSPSTYGLVRIKVKKILGIIVGGPWYEFGSLYPADQDILIAPGLSFYSETKVIKAEAGFQAISAVDVDGDGVDEVVKVNFNGFSNNKTQLKITIYSLADGETLTNRSFNVEVEGMVKDGSLYSPISREYFFGDFRGVGKTQLVTISHNKTFKNEDRQSFIALIDLDEEAKLSESSLFSYGFDSHEYLHPIDVNADGKTELCFATSSGYDVYTLQDNSFNKQTTYPNINRVTLNKKKSLFGDMNGDGKIDILLSPENSYSSGTYIDVPVWSPHYCPYCGIEYPINDGYSSHCRNCFHPIERSNYCIECNTQLEYCNYGDHSKDCCPNHGQYVPRTISTYNDKGNTWTVFYNTGKGFVSKTIDLMNVHSPEEYFLMDLNRDGLADLVQTKNSKINVYLNKKGVIENITKNPVTIPSGSKLLQANVVDLNSMSHLICVENATVCCYSYSRDESKNNLLVSMTDSHGLTHQNNYSDMTSEYGNYFATSTTRNYPFSSFIAPLNLLSSSITYGGNGYTPVSNYSYAYYGAVLHRIGLGFCGFEKIKVTDHIQNMTTEEEKSPINFGVTTKIANPVKEMIFTYVRNESSNKKANPRLIYSSEKDKLRNIYVSKSYSYDSYNNITRETAWFSDNSLRIETTQTYYYPISPEFYHLRLPRVKMVTKTRDGSIWKEKEEVHYNGDWLPEWKKTFSGVNGESKTGEIKWSYHSNGTIESEKTAPATVTEFLGNTYLYDTSGRYVESIENAMGQITTFSDFDKYGNPKTVVDFRNNTTTHTYNEWGEPVSTTYPDGVTETIATEWGGEGLFTVSHTTTGNPETITHFDALGREIRTGQQRFDGNWQFVDKEYDSRGRLQKVSLPFKGSAASLWNEYTYDTYNRPTTLTGASGKSVQWSYDDPNNKVTETNNSIVTTRAFDASGHMISATDPGGTTSYSLRPDGKPAKITAPGNVETTFEYDDLARQISIDDPSAGIQTYDPRYENNLLVYTQTNANGQSVITHYDKFGKITKVERPEFNTFYLYYDDGSLKLETSTNSTSRSFTYDEFGRMKTEKEKVPYGTSLQKTYNYQEGNITSVIYRGSFGDIATEHYLYNYGHLTEIKLNDVTSIWKLTGENALGQPTRAQTGNMERTYNYNQFGLLTGRTAGSVQSFTYNFNAQTGNLLSRKDNTRNKTEAFEYDHLNRLEVTNGEQMIYADNGNISTMPETGILNYTYESKPYQVSHLTPHGSEVPMRNQHVTYTSFQRPAEITEGNKKATFTYNAIGERVQTLFTGENNYYSEHVLIDNKYEYWLGTDAWCKEILYLGGDAYSAPAVYVCPELDNPWELYYICRDHLGSITHIVKPDGTVVQELSYDAWGRLRDPATHSPYEPGNEPELFLGRGYTGHEHLLWFGLINMNARLYDPALGRFLSPDPYVQLPDFSQNFNRYSYALNNPLKYTDPDGEFFWIAVGIGALFGSYIGGAAAEGWQMNPLKWDWDGDTWAGLGIGAVLGGAGGAGFFYTAPALASALGPGGLGFSAASSTASAFAVTGGAAGGMIGYGSGFAGGMLYSNGDWDYAFQSGIHGAKLGSALGTVAGAIGGALEGFEAPPNYNFQVSKAIEETRSNNIESDLLNKKVKPIANNSRVSGNMRLNFPMPAGTLKDYTPERIAFQPGPNNNLRYYSTSLSPSNINYLNIANSRNTTPYQNGYRRYKFNPMNIIEAANDWFGYLNRFGSLPPILGPIFVIDPKIIFEGDYPYYNEYY